MRIDKTKTIDLVVKVNGKHIRRWPVACTASLTVVQAHWWNKPRVVLLSDLTITVDGKDWTALGDSASLTIDIPVEVTVW